MSRVLALGLILGTGAFTGALLLDGPRGPKADHLEGGQFVLSGLRSMLAAHFTAKADLYFHNGYRGDVREHEPEQGGLEQKETAAESVHEDHHDHDHDHGKHEAAKPAKAAPPSGEDWISSFGKNFYVSQHAHMDASRDARELLPWFALAAKSNPKQPEVFVSGAFWLRTHLKKPQEAAEFLREGLKHNPGNLGILLELGRTLQMDSSTKTRAENVFGAALALWESADKAGREPDKEILEMILAHLVELAEARGDKIAALRLLERLIPLSPAPESIRRRITELREPPKSDR